MIMEMSVRRFIKTKIERADHYLCEKSEFIREIWHIGLHTALTMDLELLKYQDNFIPATIKSTKVQTLGAGLCNRIYTLHEVKTLN